MKVLIYTTLLFIFVILSSLGTIEAQNRAYRTLNNEGKANGNENTTEVYQSVLSLKANSLDAATVSELDSLLKNRIGVNRIQQGRRSILKLELDPTSKTSLNLLGCIEMGNRYPEVGKATPDPRISGIPTVRKMSDGTIILPGKSTEVALVEEKTSGTASTTVTTSTTPTPASSSVPTPVSQPYSPSVTAYSASPSKSQASASVSTLSPQIGEPKEFIKKKGVTLINNSDAAFFKKYSIVLGSFRNENNADFVRRTFNALGERVIIIKNNEEGFYVALLGGFDSQDEAVRKFDAFSRKYTEGMSRARRVSKYGIPLDDMWILVKE
ncbi:MAG: SPOR domain-containing protein [Dysgonomonas sp.]